MTSRMAQEPKIFYTCPICSKLYQQLAEGQTTCRNPCRDTKAAEDSKLLKHIEIYGLDRDAINELFVERLKTLEMLDDVLPIRPFKTIENEQGCLLIFLAYTDKQIRNAIEPLTKYIKNILTNNVYAPYMTPKEVREKYKEQEDRKLKQTGAYTWQKT